MLKFKVTKGNSKLGSICAINLPAVVTCRPDAPCAKLCYAKKGTFNFPNVRNCYQNNLERVLDDLEGAKQDILEQLPLMGVCRVHASGDFVNVEYLKMLMEVATIATGVKFMAFTKKYEMINDLIASGYQIPSNFKIIFSGWYGLEMQNPYNLPTAYINLKNETDERITADAIPCGGRCDKCFVCWKMNNGEQVIFEQH